MKAALSSILLICLFFSQTAPLAAAPISGQASTQITPSNEDAYLANIRLVQRKNALLLEGAVNDAESNRRGSESAASLISAQALYLQPAELIAAAAREAGYILSSQFRAPSDPADGAINNVYGSPTWIVPRENALAIIALIESAEITGNSSYLNSAAASAAYLARVQDQVDGGWYDQYDHATAVSLSKSPTQTAEVMLAYQKLGYNPALSQSMKKGAQFLLACQDPANKGGFDDGLLGGGKDANGNFQSWRWASDNAFAYQALMAAKMWALADNDTGFAAQMQDAAAKIINGINTTLYVNNPNDPDYGVWRRVVDRFGLTMEPDFHEWINYAPQMLDLPAIGVGNARVGEWIHQKFQREDGAVVWNDTWHTTRKSPGFSFQAAIVWQDLGQTAYADAAIQWARTSGLWQTTPDQNGISGGWIDWVEPNDQAPFWQRFIDTSFYSTAAFAGGYDFKIGQESHDLLLMRLQGNSQARTDFNLIYGTSVAALGNISDADLAVLKAVVADPFLRPYSLTFLDLISKTANFYRAVQSSSSLRADFNLLYGAALPATGAPSAADRQKLYTLVLDPAFSQPAFIPATAKAASLYRSLQTGTAYADFNLLYGTALQATGAPAAADRGLLFDLSSDPAFNAQTFMAVLPKAANLLRALRTTLAYRTDFNLMYGASVAVSGTPTAADRATLFGVAGDAAYNQAVYIPALTRSAAFYRALQANTPNRNDFNLLYAASITATGSPTAANRTILFSVAGDAAFNQTSYLPVLTKTATLYRALQANASYRTDFNLLYATSLATTGAPTAANRTILFGVAGDPAFNQTNYLPVLTKTATLYRAFQANALYRADFNLLYAASLPLSGAPSAADRGTLFGVAGTAGFNQATYLPVLRNASSLYTRLQGNTAKRNSFNNRYGTTLAATGSPNAAGRTKLFSIAGTPGYNETTFWNSL